MARYARISIKRHEIKGSKFQFPWSLLLLTLCSLSPVGIYTNRHFCRSRRQRYYLRPASKFGISRLLNILVGILHRETSLSLSLSACLVLPLTCPCWSCVCRSRWFSSRRRAFSLSLSLSLFPRPLTRSCAHRECAPMVTDLAHVVSATTEEESRILPIRPSSS